MGPPKLSQQVVSVCMQHVRRTGPVGMSYVVRGSVRARRRDKGTVLTGTYGYAQVGCFLVSRVLWCTLDDTQARRAVWLIRLDVGGVREGAGPCAGRKPQGGWVMRGSR